jgi:hypothetical protein
MCEGSFTIPTWSRKEDMSELRVSLVSARYSGTQNF